jgi:hypothetical protein
MGRELCASSLAKMVMEGAGISLFDRDGHPFILTLLSFESRTQAASRLAERPPPQAARP